MPRQPTQTGPPVVMDPGSRSLRSLGRDDGIKLVSPSEQFRRRPGPRAGTDLAVELMADPHSIFKQPIAETPSKGPQRKGPRHTQSSSPDLIG
jgi:hypothetical protein